MSTTIGDLYAKFAGLRGHVSVYNREALEELFEAVATLYTSLKTIELDDIDRERHIHFLANVSLMLHHHRKGDFFRAFDYLRIILKRYVYEGPSIRPFALK